MIMWKKKGLPVPRFYLPWDIYWFWTEDENAAAGPALYCHEFHKGKLKAAGMKMEEEKIACFLEGHSEGFNTLFSFLRMKTEHVFRMIFFLLLKQDLIF